MKVLLVNGSPHQNGCTNRALEEMRGEFEKENIVSEIFWIGPTVQGCIGCGRCRELKKCVFDDQVNVFAKMAQDASGFIFGSPVYYGSASGGICSFMDRLFYSSKQNFTNKVAASVVSCRRGGASMAFNRLNMYYTLNNMVVASSQYWNMVHGNTKEEVEQDLEGLQTMRTLAINMAWIIKCLETGKEAGVLLPEYEKRIATNFIRK